MIGMSFVIGTCAGCILGAAMIFAYFYVSGMRKARELRSEGMKMLAQHESETAKNYGIMAFSFLLSAVVILSVAFWLSV